MLKFTLFNSVTLIVFVINVLNFSCGLSDKRLCADPKCQKVISMGTGVINYNAGEKGMVSFKVQSVIKILSKSAGNDSSLWGIQVNEKDGYAPKRYIRENKIFIKDEDLKYIVTVGLENKEVISDQTSIEPSESVPLLADSTNTMPLHEYEEDSNVHNSKIEINKNTLPSKAQIESEILPIEISPNQSSTNDNIDDKMEKRGINIDNEEKTDRGKDINSVHIKPESEPITNSYILSEKNESFEKETQPFLKNNHEQNNDSVLPNIETITDPNVNNRIESNFIVDALEEPDIFINTETDSSTKELTDVNSQGADIKASPTSNATSSQNALTNSESSLEGTIDSSDENQIVHNLKLGLDRLLSAGDGNTNILGVDTSETQHTTIELPEKLPSGETQLDDGKNKSLSSESSIVSTLKKDPSIEFEKEEEGDKQVNKNNTNDELPDTKNSNTIEIDPPSSFESVKPNILSEPVLNISENIENLENREEAFNSLQENIKSPEAHSDNFNRQNTHLYESKEEILPPKSPSITLEESGSGEKEFVKSEINEELSEKNNSNVKEIDASNSFEPTAKSHTSNSEEDFIFEKHSILKASDLDLSKTELNLKLETKTASALNMENTVKENTKIPDAYSDDDNTVQSQDVEEVENVPLNSISSPTETKRYPHLQEESTIPDASKIHESNKVEEINKGDHTDIDNLVLHNTESSHLETSVSGDIFAENKDLEMSPEDFFGYLKEDEMKMNEKLSKSKNYYRQDVYKKHGLFANILGTVKNFIPSDKKMPEIVEEKIDNHYCIETSKETMLNLENFFKIFANKVLNNANLITSMMIVATTLLCFIFGYYLFCKSSRESNLIAKLNLLERSMLATHKENSILKHDLVATRNKLLSIEDCSFGGNDMIASLKQNLTEKQSQIEDLKRQVADLEKELETATEAGLELNKIVSDLLNNQSGEDTIINSVEELQQQLNEQERTILEINANLATKSRENSELQLLIAEQKAKFSHQITILQNDNDELEAEKSLMQARLTETKAEFEEDITKALERKNVEITRFQNELIAQQEKLEVVSNSLSASEAKVQTLEQYMQELAENSKKNVGEINDIINVRSQLLDVQNKYSSLKDVALIQKESLANSENQIKALSEEVERVKQNFHQAEKDKLEAQTRLEVLSSYFKEKEAQLQKELSVKQSMWFQQQGEAVSTVERLTAMQGEIQSLKSQNDALRAEIEAQVAAHKAQIGTLENRAHETWLAARQADRRYDEARAEAASLRRKLTSLCSKSTENNIADLPDNAMNSEGTAMSPLCIEPSGSPLLERLPPPPFLHFMGPPPVFMGMPPSFMPPGEIRPAPLGRIMSPLPQHSNHSSRYSDFEGEFFLYGDEDVHDDQLHDYRLPNDSFRRSRYSPPRTYRSHSPTESRYGFEDDRDHLVNRYDTETDLSPPASPKRRKSWRSDEYDRHSPTLSLSSSKYERRKNANASKKKSSKNDR